MKTAAQLRDGDTERTAGVRGAILHATELTSDGFEFMVRHVEWMDAGEKLVLSDETDTRANYHEAVAEFHRQHESAASDHIHS
jgi:hypothetical protein